MKVTKLSSQKRDPSRVNMYIDDTFHSGVTLDTVAKFNLYVSKDVTQEELDEILLHELNNRFQSRAMAYISRAIHTEFQLRRYLRDLSIKKKGSWYSEISKEDLEKIFENAIKKLKGYGYINDEIFAEEFINSRVKNKPRGKSVLISELMSKGVNRELAEKKVEELVEDEYDILKRVYEKKYKEEKLTKDDRKKIDFLMRKGFRWDLIEKFINNEPEE